MIKKFILFSFILSYYFNSNAQVNKTDSLDSYAWIHYIDTTHFPFNREILIKRTINSIVNGEKRKNNVVIKLKFNYDIIKDTLKSLLKNKKQCDPLIVLDGICFSYYEQNSFKVLKSLLMKREVKEITVLEHMDALYIYGSCGVIYIKTEKPKK